MTVVPFPGVQIEPEIVTDLALVASLIEAAIVAGDPVLAMHWCETLRDPEWRQDVAALLILGPIA